MIKLTQSYSITDHITIHDSKDNPVLLIVFSKGATSFTPYHEELNALTEEDKEMIRLLIIGIKHKYSLQFTPEFAFEEIFDGKTFREIDTTK